MKKLFVWLPWSRVADRREEKVRGVTEATFTNFWEGEKYRN